jgi:hypothetical protein
MAQRLSGSELTHDDLTTVLPEDVPVPASLDKRLAQEEPLQDIEIERAPKKQRKTRARKTPKDKLQGDEGRDNR